MDYFYMSKEDERACGDPLTVVVDEGTGERYGIAIGNKGVAEEGERHWLVKDASEELNTWGHPGGENGKITFKSDGERSIVAFRNALAKFHGGIVTP